jgi:hypothetical protein
MPILHVVGKRPSGVEPHTVLWKAAEVIAEHLETAPTSVTSTWVEPLEHVEYGLPLAQGSAQTHTPVVRVMSALRHPTEVVQAMLLEIARTVAEQMSLPWERPESRPYVSFENISPGMSLAAGRFYPPAE